MKAFKNNKLFSALFTTDHHTLHPHTPTRHILANMDTFYYKENNLDEIDLSVYGGDFFHDLAQANDPNILVCQRWIKNICKFVMIRKSMFEFLRGRHPMIGDSLRCLIY